MKKNEEQFPEGFDWSWTAESMDEQSKRMAEEKPKVKEDSSLLDKKTWKKPPF